MLFTSPSSAHQSSSLPGSSENMSSSNHNNDSSVSAANNNNATETSEFFAKMVIGDHEATVAKTCDDISCNTELNASLEARNPEGKRTMEELTRLVRSEHFDPTHLTNEEILELMLLSKVSVYKLESVLGKSNAKRCVDIRRQYYHRLIKLIDDAEQSDNSSLPPLKLNTNRMHRPSNHPNLNEHRDSTDTNVTDINVRAIKPASKADVLFKPQNSEFDYTRVVGACCENVIGYIRLPVGIVGPLKLDGQDVFVPLATTEGCLVASTHRGLSALTRSGGVMSRITKNSMTRAPIVRFQDTELRDALNNRNKAIEWLQDPVNKQKIKVAFRSTSKHTNLMDYTLHPHGRELHIRFEAQTGDAMGMNMCSKGAEMALKEMQRVFPTMDILTLSGNMCTDKKPSAINWVNGRGKSVECNATLPAEVVEKVFKVPVDSLIEVWSKKVMVGSALAGSVGGFNCHAANIVAAIFIATGQDTAQVVSSSNCMITLEKDSRGSLAVHCSMPSIECGTVGGGTVLEDQSNYLQLMGIKGPTMTQQVTASVTNGNDDASGSVTDHLVQHDELDSDSNACKLAKIICSTVMAGELSLMAALTEGTLVKSHMTHNRSAQQCKVL